MLSYGRSSGIIAPYGICALWEPNEKEIRYIVITGNIKVIKSPSTHSHDCRGPEFVQAYLAFGQAFTLR